MKTRVVVRTLAGPGIRAAQDIYGSGVHEELRAAALVDVATAAAAMARTLVRFRHLDPRRVMALAVWAAPGDVRAVLGRGAWLPTMTRCHPLTNDTAGTGGPHLPTVATPAPVTTLKRGQRRRTPAPGQLVLFTTTTTWSTTTTTQPTTATGTATGKGGTPCP